MKFLRFNALLILLVWSTAWKGQNKTDLPTDAITSETSALADHPNFSGDWKLNESNSELGEQFPLCIFGGGDRMRSKIMKISVNAYFLTVDVASSSSDGELVMRQEKVTFGDMETAATFVGIPRVQSAARWSDDGQTMTISSARFLKDDGEKIDFKVTEVWKLINEGKSISVRVHSSSTYGERTMKLVYDRQRASDYRF